MAQKRSIIFDAVNSNPRRALKIVRARDEGYFVEALAFFNSDAEVFVNNVAKRKSDQAVLKAETVRDRFRALLFYSSDFKVDPLYRKSLRPDIRLRDIDELYYLPDQYPDLATALSKMEAGKRAEFEQVMAEDIFNRVEVVKTMAIGSSALSDWHQFALEHPQEFTIQYPPRREFFQDHFLVSVVPMNIDCANPLLLYVHVPFCEKKCYFCNFAVDVRNKEDVFSGYTSALLKELDRYKFYLDKKTEIRGIDIGGGTPTRLPVVDLERLLVALAPFRAASRHPFPLSIETTPLIASGERERLRVLAENGVDRVSMGIQSFNEDQLIKVNRGLHKGKNEAAAENIHALPFKRFNIDLIFGLPHQTEAQWLEDLQRVVALGPASITTYDCLYRGKGRTLTKLEAQGIPSQETYGKLYDLGYDFLRAHGYFAPYGSVNFSKRPGETGTSAYFEGRLLDALPYFGLGNYSSSWVDDFWYFNVYRVDEYLKKMAADESPVGDFYRLPKAELYAKYILYSLNYGIIDSQKFFARFGVDFETVFKTELDFAVEKGWIYRDGNLWKLPYGSFKSLNFLRSLFYSRQAQAWLQALHSQKVSLPMVK